MLQSLFVAEVRIAGICRLCYHWSMTRSRRLPPGWYPTSARDVKAQVEQWSRELPAVLHRRFCSVIVPHAGWLFSGVLAFDTIRRLRTPVRTAIVVGGHLRASDPLLVGPDDAYEVPGGSLPVDEDLRSAVRSRFATADDTVSDNTVEIQLPLVAELFPDARVLWLRSPPSTVAVDLGRFLAEQAPPGAVVIGSTDLTHYGPNYHFSPAGGGEAGLAWARENDRAITQAMSSMQIEEVLRLAAEQRAACSAGAAATAIAYGKRLGSQDGEIVGLRSSAEVHAADSVVGYVGIGFALE